MKDTPKGKTALITGATGGFGSRLASIHASRGGNLVLVGRNEAKLSSLREKLSGSGTEIRTFTADLKDEDSAEKIHDFTLREGIEVDYLINDAGFGGGGSFSERPMAGDLDEIAVNVVALTKLMKLFLPDFIKRGSGRIMNVASQAALVPGPGQAVYFATKAFVDSLSNAVWEEVRHLPGDVSVTSVLPGPMETGFIAAASAEKMPLFRHSLSPEKPALKAYEAMLKGRLRVCVAMKWWQKPVMALLPLYPRRLVLRVVWLLQR